MTLLHRESGNYTHPLNTTHQHTLSKHTINTPSQPALSTHPLNTPSQPTLSSPRYENGTPNTITTYALGGRKRSSFTLQVQSFGTARTQRQGLAPGLRLAPGLGLGLALGLGQRSSEWLHCLVIKTITTKMLT